MAAKKLRNAYRQTEEELQQERKNRRKAIVGTITFYSLILLLVIFMGLTPPDPPLPEAEGMEIVLGNDAVGMNETFEPVAAGNPQPETVESTPPQEITDPEPALPEENDPDAVPIEQKKVEVKKEATEKPREEVKPKETTETPKEEKKQERQVDKRTLFEKTDGNSNGSGGTNTSKGTGDKSGDQGDPNGDPKSPSWTARGQGNSPDGIGFDLGGRGKLYIPRVEDNSQTEGKIVVEIAVDRSGKVVKARGGIRGSTITNPSLISLVEQKALEAKFTADPNAPEIQYGSITYNFKLK